MQYRRGVINSFATLAVALWLVSSQAEAKEKLAPFSQAKSACQVTESWVFSSEVPKSWRDEFASYVSGGLSQVFGFSEAMALQKVAKSAESQLLGVYWKNRALYRSGLIHMAASGFNWVASQPVKPRTIGIQLAALACLNKIHYEYPRVYMAKSVEDNLPNYRRRVLSAAVYPQNKDVYWQALSLLARVQISERRSGGEIRQTIDLLTGSGPYKKFAKGLYAIEKERFKSAIANLRSFVDEPKLPLGVRRYLDPARLTLARAYYKTSNYAKAEEQLKKIDKNSNEIIPVLTELSWAHLMQNEYGESVGVAMSLQSGGLRSTFAPEGLMVMAMALNELCQYPASLRSVRFLKSHYRSSYFWLKEWMKDRKAKKNKNLYQFVVNFLENNSSVIPKPILSEWMRSPVFVTHQEELNLFLDERESETKFISAQKKEYTKLKGELAELTTQVNRTVVASRAALGPGQSLPAHVRDAMDLLKQQRSRFNRLKESIKGFRKVARLFRKQARILTAKLRKRMNAELAYRSVGMLKRLKDTAENSYLIEVEIYNGASEDVVWQNAHPDYKKFTLGIRDDKSAEQAERVWNWGRKARSEDGVEEVWADELGTLRADLHDNCGNKDKYLNVRFDLVKNN